MGKYSIFSLAKILSACLLFACRPHINYPSSKVLDANDLPKTLFGFCPTIEQNSFDSEFTIAGKLYEVGRYIGGGSLGDVKILTPIDKTLPHLIMKIDNKNAVGVSMDSTEVFGDVVGHRILEYFNEPTTRAGIFRTKDGKYIAIKDFVDVKKDKPLETEIRSLNRAQYLMYVLPIADLWTRGNVLIDTTGTARIVDPQVGATPSALRHLKKLPTWIQTFYAAKKEEVNKITSPSIYCDSVPKDLPSHAYGIPMIVDPNIIFDPKYASIFKSPIKRRINIEGLDPMNPGKWDVEIPTPE